MKVDLEKLRSLPQHTRAQISFLTALGVAGVIALVWATTLGSRFEAPAVLTEAPQKEAQQEIVVKVPDSDTDWGALMGKIKGQIGNVFAAWSSIRIETGANEGSKIEMSKEGGEGNPEPRESRATGPTSTPQGEESRTVLVGTSTVKMAE